MPYNAINISFRCKMQKKIQIMENLTNSAIKCKTVRIYPEDAERLYGEI